MLVAIVTGLTLMAVPALASAAGPTAIGQDSQGVSYVGYGDSGTISRYDASGNALSSWATSSTAIVAITVDPSGDVWVLDPAYVSEYSPSGALITSFEVELCSPHGGTLDPAQYGGLAVTADAVYVASPCFADLYRYSLTGTLEQTQTLPGQPRGVAVGPAGSNANQVFVAIPSQHEVLTYDAATFATNAAEPPLTVDGAGSSDWTPSGVAVKDDSGGDELIVSDTLNNYLYVYDPSHLNGPGGTYSEYRTLGHGTGSAEGSVDDPTAIALHGADGSSLDTNIFIADYGNSRIQRWNDSGYTWWTAAATGPGTVSAPTNTTAPSISGSPVVGSAVTCASGSWTGSPTSFAYAWQDNGAAISGATASSYTIQAADAGQSLTCSVIASNGAGASSAATSAAVVPASAASAPANTAAPAITGQASPGGTLTCNAGTWTGTAPITYTYAWSRNGTQVATGQTYTVVAADVGAALTCTVTGSNSAGSAVARSAAVTPTATASAKTVGITIDAGAVYTNNAAVTVTVIAPAGTTSILLSNDGGFTDPQSFAVAGDDEYAWTLQTSGSERLPKVVYVRFVGAGASSYLTLSDDIVLDTTAPTVQSATLSAVPAAKSAARAALVKTRSGGYLLKVKAKDTISGVAKLQYASTRNARKATTVRYSASIRVAKASSAVWVRVIDRAGNDGKWRRVLRAKTT